MKKKLEEGKATRSGDAITKGAMQLRNDIKKQDISRVWLPDMENSVSVIPESVTMFLHTLLARDGECANPSGKESDGLQPLLEVIWSMLSPVVGRPNHQKIYFSRLL